MERNEFYGEPRRTLCTELCGDATVIPVWAWGEVDEAGRDSRDPEMGWRDLENLSEEAFYADRNESEDDCETSRDPLVNRAGVVQAGSRLIDMLGISITRAMCDIVGQYMVPDECRMDAVISYFLKHKQEEGVVDAAVEFAEKMESHIPAISKEARKRLANEARKERKAGEYEGPAFRLGHALFDTNWQRIIGNAA